jgi:hypothetical protein
MIRAGFVTLVLGVVLSAAVWAYDWATPDPYGADFGVGFALIATYGLIALGVILVVAGYVDRRDKRRQRHF